MKENVKSELNGTKKEVEELGGLESFKNGDWVIKLIKKSFSNYYNNANWEYFSEKYDSQSKEFICKKLINVAAKNSSILGGLTGTVISFDEIIALITGGEALLGLPANFAVAATAICGESILLLRIQLQLVANLFKLYDVPIDINDPEDILVILTLAFGISVAEIAQEGAVKVGGKITENLIRKFISKDVLNAIKAIGKKIGIKILQRNILKYAVPGVSIGIGSTWNFATTKAVAKVTMNKINERLKEQINSDKY